MKKRLANILFYGICSVLLLDFSYALGMLTSFNTKDIQNPLRPSCGTEISNMRKTLEMNELILCMDPYKITEISPKTKIIKVFSPQERVGICHAQSLAMFLGVEGKLFEHVTMAGATLDLSVIDIAAYCDYVEEPEKGDFVVYSFNTNNECSNGKPVISHSAIYAGNGRAVSKFRIIPALVEHELNEVPENYVVHRTFMDSAILFFRKKVGVNVLEEVKVRLQKQKIQDYLAMRYKTIKEEIFTTRVYDEATQLPEFVAEYVNKNYQGNCTIEPISLYQALQSYPGFNINETNEAGETLLMLAVDADRKQATRLLLKSGVNTNAKNNRGMTALMIAGMKSNIDMMEELIAYGADVTIPNNDGDTVYMMIAARYKKMEQLLIDAGVNIGKVNT